MPINFIPKPKQPHNKVALFDVMCEGRFIFQLPFEYCPLFRFNVKEVEEAVYAKRPTLRGKDITLYPVTPIETKQ